jgi:probable F420-dependent oxidoreductase
VQIGISAYDIAAGDLVELAAAADEAGFDSLWLGEHVVLPVGYASEHPTAGSGAHHHHSGPIVDPSTRLLDPLVALAGCAVATRSITLATGIYLVPLRAPLAVARMVHTLQALSGGRFLLGAGAGWLEEEFDALGAPFAGRGARLEEALAVIRSALAGGPVEHSGEHFRISGVQLCEEQLAVPVVLGGNTERALRRAARLGDGWFTSGTPAREDTCRLRDRLVALRVELGRTGDFPVYARIAAPDPELLDGYAAEGLDRLVVWADQVWPAGEDLAGKRAALAATASRLGLAPRSATVP